jgi:hypothetical protein
VELRELLAVLRLITAEEIGQIVDIFTAARLKAIRGTILVRRLGREITIRPRGRPPRPLGLMNMPLSPFSCPFI